MRAVPAVPAACWGWCPNGRGAGQLLGLVLHCASRLRRPHDVQPCDLAQPTRALSLAHVSSAGNRGYYLKNEGVLLNQALINCALQFGYCRGFKPVHTPFFMQASAVGGVAAQPLRGCYAAGGAPRSGLAMPAAAHAHEAFWLRAGRSKPASIAICLAVKHIHFPAAQAHRGWVQAGALLLTVLLPPTP